MTGIFFDLDGTLCDTADDFAYALTCIGKKYGFPIGENLNKRVRDVLTSGTHQMLSLITDNPEDETVHEEFVQSYYDNITRHTNLFDGMLPLLEKLEAEKLSWGIVTNKANWLTFRLLDALNLPHTPAAVVCGDTLERAKPHPDPLLFACKQANVLPDRSIYIGDALQDIQAGNAAGMHTIGALFGYIKDKGAASKDWPANDFIDTPHDIWPKIEDWLGKTV